MNDKERKNRESISKYHNSLLNKTDFYWVELSVSCYTQSSATVLLMYHRIFSPSYSYICVSWPGWPVRPNVAHTQLTRYQYTASVTVFSETDQTSVQDGQEDTRINFICFTMLMSRGPRSPRQLRDPHPHATVCAWHALQTGGGQAWLPWRGE